MKHEKNISQQRWLNRNAAAMYLGISPATFDRELRDLLPASNISSRPVWDREDIDNLLLARKAKVVSL